MSTHQPYVRNYNNFPILIFLAKRRENNLLHHCVPKVNGNVYEGYSYFVLKTATMKKPLKSLPQVFTSWMMISICSFSGNYFVWQCSIDCLVTVTMYTESIILIGYLPKVVITVLNILKVTCGSHQLQEEKFQGHDFVFRK